MGIKSYSYKRLQPRFSLLSLSPSQKLLSQVLRGLSLYINELPLIENKPSRWGAQEIGTEALNLKELPKSSLKSQWAKSQRSEQISVL